MMLLLQQMILIRLTFKDNTTLTVTNNSDPDILTNDTDSDSGDSKTVTGIRTGATEGWWYCRYN